MSNTEMLINYVPGEECRIAIVVDGKLEEFYQERASAGSTVGNIYKGKVTNVEPSIQAAFVDFGQGRNGFLHITDLHPSYFSGKHHEDTEQVGSKTPRHERPPIQKCLKRGQDILVQVLKEGIGTKGPTLTSYLSIPGRFLVMMPQMQRLGVSRKVDDDEARREMKKILTELKPPQGFGFIIRTAGIGQTKTELKRDLAYLVRLWKNIEQRKKKLKGVGELYTEQDLIIRTIRDVFTNDITRVVIDNPQAAKRANDFLAIASPRSRPKVVYYHDPVPLFHRFDIERQIESINAREVPLKSGGSLVFDQAEALVAIDVNSGKSRSARDAESNAFHTNMEAVDEICRQLRLRDLGGVIVNDLIDMRDPKRRRQVEARFRANLKKDRARTRVGSISQFGLLEMTRQRMRPSLASSLSVPCSACSGRGHVKSAESVVLDVMRRLALVLSRAEVVRAELIISPDAAFHLLNKKRSQLVDLETRYGKPVTVRVGGQSIDFVDIRLFDERGGQMDFESLSSTSDIAPPTDTTFIEIQNDVLPDIEGLDYQGDQESPELDLTAHDEAEQTLIADALSQETNTEKSSKRRRRRRRKGKPQDTTLATDDDAAEQEQVANQEAQETTSPDTADNEYTVDTTAENSAQEKVAVDSPASSENATKSSKKKRRRRRRNKAGQAEQPVDTPDHVDNAFDSGNVPPVEEGQTTHTESGLEDTDSTSSKKKKRRRRNKKRTSDSDGDSVTELPSSKTSDMDSTQAAEENKPRKRSRRRRNNGKAQADSKNTSEETQVPSEPIQASTGYRNRLIKSTETAGDAS